MNDNLSRDVIISTSNMSGVHTNNVILPVECGDNFEEEIAKMLRCSVRMRPDRIVLTPEMAISIAALLEQLQALKAVFL